MRHNSPRTARVDSQEEVAMLYDDTRNAPKTAEDHEKDAYGSTCLTGECLDVLSGVVDEAVHYVEAAREHIAQAEGGEPANS